MHMTSPPKAMRMKPQPKLRTIQPSVLVMTDPRLSGPSRPHATNAAMIRAEPQNTYGSIPLYRFIALP
jgi:hypothetical protein